MSRCFAKISLPDRRRAVDRYLSRPASSYDSPVEGNGFSTRKISCRLEMNFCRVRDGSGSRTGFISFATGNRRPISDLAKVASAAGFVDTEDDQNERCCHEHPAWMATTRPPKIAESAKQVGAANE